jgi:hypothetical protein
MLISVNCIAGAGNGPALDQSFALVFVLYMLFVFVFTYVLRGSLLVRREGRLRLEVSQGLAIGDWLCILTEIERIQTYVVGLKLVQYPVTSIQLSLIWQSQYPVFSIQYLVSRIQERKSQHQSGTYNPRDTSISLVMGGLLLAAAFPVLYKPIIFSLTSANSARHKSTSGQKMVTAQG